MKRTSSYRWFVVPQPQNSGQNKKKAFVIVVAVVAVGLTAGYF